MRPGSPVLFYTFTAWEDDDRQKYLRCAGHLAEKSGRLKNKLARAMTRHQDIPDLPVRVVNEAGGLLASFPSIYRLAGIP